MPNTFYLEVVTPDRTFFSEDVEMIVLNTPDGEVGIMAGHIPIVAAVAVGTLKIKKDGEWHEAVLTEGFMEVTQKKTIILADTAEWPDEIDERRAEAARIRAEERLQSKLSQIEYVQSRAALTRAMTRLKAKGRGPG